MDVHEGTIEHDVCLLGQRMNPDVDTLEVCHGEPRAALYGWPAAGVCENVCVLQN